MGENDTIVHSSIWLEVNGFATWNVRDSDQECDCPGPPPQFNLPPPPWTHIINDFRCMDNMISRVGICKTFSVISDECHCSLTLTPLSVIPIVAAVVFLFIGTILVIVSSRRKIQQLYPRKSSTTSYCESAIASSIIYENMTDIHTRELTCLGSQCQLPSTEMIRTSQNMLSPVLICPSSPVPKSHSSEDLFSPVYKEFSSVYNVKRGISSEGILSNFNSEDECAEDDLSVEEGVENYPNTARESNDSLLLGTNVADCLRSLDFPVANDKSRFLESCGKNLNSAFCPEKEARTFRGVHVCSRYGREKGLKKNKTKLTET